MRHTSRGWVLETVFRKTFGDCHVDLNMATRRYGIVMPLRMAAFYANAMQETMWFGKLHEDNSSTRYWSWDGRGFLQLTWPYNYIKYWRFAGKRIDATLARDLENAQVRADHERTNAPLEARVSSSMREWRNHIGDGQHLPVSADTAGVYWAWSKAARNADRVGANVYATKPVSNAHLVYYKSTPFGEVAATVNVGAPSTNFDKVNGITARFQAYTACQMALFDVTAFPNRQGDVRFTPIDYRQRRP